MCFLTQYTRYHISCSIVQFLTAIYILVNIYSQYINFSACYFSITTTDLDNCKLFFCFGFHWHNICAIFHKNLSLIQNFGERDTHSVLIAWCPTCLYFFNNKAKLDKNDQNNIINIIFHTHKINVMVSFSNVTVTADEGPSPCDTRSKYIAVCPLSNSVDKLAVFLTRRWNIRLYLVPSITECMEESLSREPNCHSPVQKTPCPLFSPIQSDCPWLLFCSRWRHIIFIYDPCLIFLPSTKECTRWLLTFRILN